MRIIFLFMLLLASVAHGESLKKDDLPGVWHPSGMMPREDGVRNYKLIIKKDMTAKYVALGNKNNPPSLTCNYKPSNSQDSIFVYYCYLGDDHLITLSLGGWVSDSTMMLYGYEYWLGYPKPGEIYGGLPVSLTRARSH